MDFISQHDFPNISDSSFASSHSHKMMEVSPFEGFYEHDWTHHFPYSIDKHHCFNDLPDIENFNFDLSLPLLGEEEMEEVEQKPLKPEKGFGGASVVNEKGFPFDTGVKKEEEEEEEEEDNAEKKPLPRPRSSVKKNKTKSCALEFEQIKKYFGVPINEAAKRMDVGLTLLKRRCRELNIMRWPHRKLKSLQTIIDNVKELGLSNEIAKLEKHKRMLEKLPGMELSEETKKLRQACFKANYKRRRCLALNA
ncbi:hypothetical protein Fmac_007543 [Flemingia macrophylla]|uniref:RWP-RK domain-containing protein n=1 Tax=Flemingia macrophylla TaxID=520843 RepID=A0ABD1MVY4_9FABA